MLTDAGIGRQLFELLADSLDISPSLYERAADRHRSLGEWLCRDASRLREFSPHVSPQGSFRLGTVVRPLASDAVYDLDPPPPAFEWVRYGPDILLIDLGSGQIAQVIYGAFDDASSDEGAAAGAVSASSAAAAPNRFCIPSSLFPYPSSLPLLLRRRLILVEVRNLVLVLLLLSRFDLLR